MYNTTSRSVFGEGFLPDAKLFEHTRQSAAGDQRQKEHDDPCRVTPSVAVQIVNHALDSMDKFRDISITRSTLYR